MKRFLNVLLFYFKRLFSIKVYAVSYIVLFLFLASLLFTADASFLSMMISDMAVPMQIHLLLMLLSGFFIIKDEARYGVLTKSLGKKRL